MKSVLISIHPKWCELIASGKKTVEVRKTKPKIQLPFKCYIYETKGKTDIPAFVDEEGHEIYEGRGEVIGEFVCDRIDEFRVFDNGAVQFWNFFNLEKSCLTYDEIADYTKEGKNGYAWRISELKVYDAPKPLYEFIKDGHCQCRIRKCPYLSPPIYWDGWGRDCYATFDTTKHTPITFPPQSWCYVESLENEEAANEQS